MRKYRAEGNHAKADRIKKNNLGKVKINNRKETAQARLRTIAYKSVHAVVDKTSVVVAEDLSSPISRKKSFGRDYNRRMASWAKGVLAEALEAVSGQRSANLELVNAAYTSQMDSRTGRLEGKRSGARFITVTGEVVHADVNAARNVRDRLKDPEITRYMPFRKVKKVLLRRFSGGVLPVMRPELSTNTLQPGADITINTQMEFVF